MPGLARGLRWRTVSKPAAELHSLSFDGVAVASRAFRPTNVTRSLFHLASGAVTLALLRLLPGRAWLVAASAAFVAAAWTMEAARRRSAAVNERLMRFFGPVAHPHERHRVNSSTWYVTALLALALLAPRRAAEIGVVVLAVADPVAGLVGRRFGRTRLRAERSLEGTLAFVAAGVLAALAWIAASHALPWSSAVALSVAAAAAGALAELASTRLDDNFTIPIAAAAAAAAAQLALPAM
jgi:dolichol kinase